MFFRIIWKFEINEKPFSFLNYSTSLFKPSSSAYEFTMLPVGLREIQERKQLESDFRSFDLSWELEIEIK